MKHTIIAPAWQARDDQRQKFVEKTVRKIWDEKDRQDDNGLFKESLLLALVVIITKRNYCVVPEIWNQVIQSQTVAMRRLVGEIVDDAIYFGRVLQEINLVLGMIMEKIANSIQTEIMAEMSKKQLFSTEEVLGVESATEDVEYIIEE